MSPDKVQLETLLDGHASLTAAVLLIRSFA